jgi:hypothetical protein
MSNNDWTGDYQANRAAQSNAAFDSEMAALRQQSEVPNITITGSGQSPQQEPMGVGKAIYEGGKAGVRNTFNAIDDVANWLNDNVINLRTEEQQRMYDQYKATGVRGYAQDGIDLSPDAPKPTEGLANFAYATTEFLTGFIPALKAVRGLSGAAALTKAGMIAEGAAAGAAGAFFSLDPKEERLSNMLNDNLPAWAKNPVSEYLAADPMDSAIEGRFKNSLENAALGVVGDVALNGIFKAIKAAKSHFVENGVNPLDALKFSTDKKIATESIKTELDNIIVAADDAAKAGGTQAEVKVSKELGDHLTKTGSAYDIESLRAARQAMDNPPVPHTVSPETAGVLPKDSSALKFDGSPQVLKTPQGDFNVSVRTNGENHTLDLVDTNGKIQYQANLFSDSDFPGWLGIRYISNDGKDYSGLGSTFYTTLADYANSKGYKLLAGVESTKPARKVHETLLNEGKASKLDAMQFFPKEEGEKFLKTLYEDGSTRQLVEILPTKAAVEAAPIVNLKVSATELDDVVGKLNRGEHLDAEATKGIDFNFNNIDAPDQIRSMINTFSDSIKGAVEKTTRGKVSFEQISQFADEIGSNAKNIESLYTDTGVLAERVTAGRIMLNKSSNALVDLAQRARELSVSLTASPEDKQLALLALRKQAMIHGEIQAQLKGTQTEIARALGAMRITTQDARFTKDELGSLIEHFGGDKLNMEFANSIIKLADDPVKMNQMIRKSGWVRSLDMLQEVFTNSILSGPITHATNIIGNSVRSLAGVAETGIASAVGKTRRMLGSDLDAADFNEAVAQAHGLTEGLMDIVRLMREGKLSEVGNFGGAKVDGGAFFEPAITAGNLGANADTMLGRLVNGLGSVIRVPGMALQFEDNVFKQVNVRASLRQNATRMAKEEGLYGQRFLDRVAELINDPPEQLMTKAHEDATDAVFAKSLEKDGGALDRMGIWLQTAKNEGLNGKALVPGLHFIIPFVKTPTNILKYAWERMPVLGLMNQQAVQTLKAGGREADMLIAKQTMGATALMLGSYLADNEVITGGLPQMTKAQKEVAGIQPYSIKIGDKWVAYNRLDPIGLFLGLMADYKNLSGNIDEFTRDEFAYAATLSLVNNLGSKTYLQGIFNTIGAIDAAKRGQTDALEKWAASMTSAFIPYAGLRNQMNRAYGDDTAREVNGYVDRIMATIPGFSSTLPPHRNLLTGDPIVYEGGMGIDIASPFYTKTEVNDPVANELSRLKLASFKHPPKRMYGIDLSPEQYDRFMVLMTKEPGADGKNMHQVMTDAVNARNWETLTEGVNNGEEYYPGGKEFTLMRIFNSYKKAAWYRLIGEDPALAQKFITQKTNKANGLMGLPVNPVNE